MLTLNYRYRIYPDADQEQRLIEWMEICRLAYNYVLGEIKDWCNSRKCLIDRCSLEKEYIIPADAKFPSEIQQLNNLPKAKKEFPKLKEVPSQVLQQAIKQLYMRIIRKANRWYASINIQCDVSVPDHKPHGHPIGVDVGLEKFLATSDGAVVRLPKFFKTMHSKLKLLQCRLSRKNKRSKNYEKQRLKVARLHHQIDNTRKDFHFKQAHALCDAGDMVFMEDLDYRISAKGMLGKQMLDAGFGQFRTITQYICWKRGKFFAVVDARGTSQECPECKGEVKKDLSIRVHDCPHCGYKTDRDVASGQVIRNRGIELISTVGQTGKETACADDLPGIGESQSRQVSKSRKGVTRKSSK